MKFESVAAIWQDFADHALAGEDPKMNANYRSVFYAASEAMLVAMLAAPHMFAGDEVKIMAYLKGLFEECHEYFEKIREAQRGND